MGIISELLLHLQEDTSKVKTVALGCSEHIHYSGIMEVKSYIDNHPFVSFRLTELSNRAGMSRSFFCTLFKEMVGVSPIVYSNMSKINHAKKLLRQTGKSATEISYDCGFETVTYFFRVFKKVEGLTPIQYRNRSQRRID
ncbi:helix-turn-helix domain-containing protein [Cohnella silvisoli]|uniref:AraC family transcriptional regulator n=1 Tax=Cohnella silvisoli TaxID=2873699 RepID=A0ABV1KWE7_9BACL|nr:AraC family transcriptional regulator [Cohnella silvisoli]MCD9023720.1 AraC family transcriptional regulator [Cohnella silvisoli]